MGTNSPLHEEHSTSLESSPSRYECPICLTWLKEPMLTLCGHHFCKSCIASWLQKEGARCPIDNQPLQPERDLFPDNFTRREISQQRMKCLNSLNGCSLELAPEELDEHMQTCGYKVQECMFKNAGCEYVSQNTTDLTKHTESSVQQHLLLLMNMYLKKSDTAKLNTSAKDVESEMWSPQSKQGEKGFKRSNSLPHLVHAMYERIVILEQRANEQEIIIKNLNTRLMESQSETKDSFDKFTLRYCNGVYIWKIKDFMNKLQLMKEDHNKIYYSDGFYTSPNGYQFCGRFNLSNKENKFLALFVHIMQTDHDECLNWPFNGRITLMISHPIDSQRTIKEAMMTRPDLGAFQKPNSSRNILGFGYSEFVLIDELLSKEYLQDGILTVIVKVQTV